MFADGFTPDAVKLAERLVWRCVRQDPTAAVRWPQRIADPAARSRVWQDADRARLMADPRAALRSIRENMHPISPEAACRAAYARDKTDPDRGRAFVDGLAADDLRAAGASVLLWATF